MDEVEILKETLNSTLQRHARIAQNYEIEVANLTVEIIRLRSALDEVEAAVKGDAGVKAEVKKADTTDKS